jgi:hypothetical protein
MSPYVILVFGGLVLFAFCLLIGVGLIAVTYYFRSKTYLTQRRYDLVERGLDRDPKAGLKEINKALRYIDSDLRGRHSGRRNVGDRRPPTAAAHGRQWFPQSRRGAAGSIGANKTGQLTRTAPAVPTGARCVHSGHRSRSHCDAAWSYIVGTRRSRR